jgi:glycosyltransferase involved in cell wall biosynthesis
VSRTDLCAVIPAFQAEGTLGAVVAGTSHHLSRVVVVDDGSRDATARVAREAGAEVVVLERNRGKGFALRTGIERALAAGPEAIVLLDADGQHHPDDLPAFLAAWDARHPDLVIGCRLEDRRDIPPARFWTNYIGSRILSWMSGYELLDSQSGYRLLSAGLARSLGLSADGYAIESEMLIKAARRGARLEHVRVRTIYNDAGSHFRPVLDTFRISCASIYFKVFDDESRAA